MYDIYLEGQKSNILILSTAHDDAISALIGRFLWFYFSLCMRTSFRSYSLYSQYNNMYDVYVSYIYILWLKLV